MWDTELASAGSSALEVPKAFLPVEGRSGPILFRGDHRRTYQRAFFVVCRRRVADTDCGPARWCDGRFVGSPQLIGRVRFALLGYPNRLCRCPAMWNRQYCFRTRLLV